MTDDNWKQDINNDMTGQENTQDGFGRYEELRDDNLMSQFEDEPYVTRVEPPKKKSFKEKISFAIFFLMIVGVSGWCLISGVRGLLLAPVHSMDEAFTKLVEGDVYEGTIDYITPEIGELKHTINFIPAGTEHYYLMYLEGVAKAVPIRVPKKWDKEYTGNAAMEVSLQARGIVREMDYDVRNVCSHLL